MVELCLVTSRRSRVISTTMNHSQASSAMKCLPLLPVLLLPFVAGCELFLYSGEETPRPCPPFEGFFDSSPTGDPEYYRERFIVDDGSCQLVQYPGLWGPYCIDIRYDSVFSSQFCTKDGAEITVVISGGNKCPGPDQDLQIDSIYLAYEGGVYTEVLADTIFSSWCSDQSGSQQTRSLRVHLSARLRDPERDNTVRLHNGIISFVIR